MTTIIAWLMLVIAIGFLGYGLYGVFDYVTYSNVDLTVDRLKWATSNINGTPSGPEPTGKELPITELAAGGIALAAWAMLWSISKLSRLTIAIGKAARDTT